MAQLRCQRKRQYQSWSLECFHPHHTLHRVPEVRFYSRKKSPSIKGRLYFPELQGSIYCSLGVREYPSW